MPTVRYGPGKLLYMQVTNIGDQKIVLPPHTTLGMWMKGETAPRAQGYMLYGSGRYKECQTLAYENTTDEQWKWPDNEWIESPANPSNYVKPINLMARPEDDPVETAKEAAVIIHRVSRDKLGGESIKTASGGENSVVDMLPHDDSCQSSADRDRKVDPQFLTQRDRGVIQPSRDRSVQHYIERDREVNLHYLTDLDREYDPQRSIDHGCEGGPHLWTYQDREVNPPSHDESFELSVGQDR